MNSNERWRYILACAAIGGLLGLGAFFIPQLIPALLSYLPTGVAAFLGEWTMTIIALAIYYFAVNTLGFYSLKGRLPNSTKEWKIILSVSFAAAGVGGIMGLFGLLLADVFAVVGGGIFDILIFPIFSIETKEREYAEVLKKNMSESTYAR
jgi:hypothetical protein